MSSLTRTVSARWLGAYRCDVSAGDFTIPVDEPTSVGGTNEGPQPTELLLAALSSCFTWPWPTRPANGESSCPI